MSSTSRNRKYDSGSQKRKKKQRLMLAAESQKGALDKFVLKEPQHNSENQTPYVNVDEGHDDDDANITVEVEGDATENFQGDDANIVDDANGHTDAVDPSLDRSRGNESNNDINNSF